MTQLIDAGAPAASLSRAIEDRLDAVLRPLIDAGDDETTKREALEQLLVTVAAPVMKAVLRRKIGEIGTGRRFRAEDEEDIAAAAMVRLIRRLSHDLTVHPIERFKDYVAAVASHAFNDHLRRQEPERTQLAATIVRVLRRDPRFDVWRHGEQRVGGSVEWRGQKAASVDPERLRGALPPAGNVAEALAIVFRISDAPLAIPSLTAVLALRFAGGRSLPDQHVAEIAADDWVPWHELHRGRRADAVWREIKLLPREQRLVVLLHLRDSHRRTALRFFPITGVATLPEIAAAMGLNARALADLWRELPMPDEQIAERLGIPRQRVINLRSSARKRLARRLRKEGLW